MAKYKNSDRSQMQIKMIDFSNQLVEGTIEHTIDYLIENKIDLSIFDSKFRNDQTGAPAYHPRVMLKVILYAYTNGITTSRKIEKACEENIIFMTLAADSQPHYTYVAQFIHRFGKEIENTFLEVLLVCWEMDLIGGGFLALDGCKLPSNSARELSGTFSDLKKKEMKIRKTVKFLLEKHKSSDDSREQKKANRNQIEKITAKADKIKNFLENNDPKMGTRNKEIQSNITDNESAKMKTSKGVIQGYNGMAMVDSKNQVIIHAEAHGGIGESQFTQEFIGNAQTALLEKEIPDNFLTEATLLADTGFFSEDNLKFLSDENINSIIPDQRFRKRDPRFDNMERHKKDGSKKRFLNSEFIFDFMANEFLCPNGERLSYVGVKRYSEGTAHKYVTATGICTGCDKKSRCLKKGNEVKRNLHIPIPKYGRNYCKEMMAKIDSPEGRDLYSKRMGIVEPVFGNIRHCKGMNRFNYRGQRKVDLQWLVFCMVNNVGKISNAMRN